jgi:predicted ATPase/DNA-binding winged helix-turn-helix (wHTH) protein
MDTDANGFQQIAAFGPYRLFPSKRLLETDGAPVQLGSRALDLLILLVERAGEVVSKNDLIGRTWPNITVDESSLRFHISSLRKTIGDGQGGARYIANVAGRGYCFVAPVTRSVGRREAAIAEPAGPPQTHKLPFRRTWVVGREEAERAIIGHLAARRFVTIHGPGGVGKTTVAVSIAHAQLAAFDSLVYFCDLGRLVDPHHVPSAMASAFGLAVQSTDPTPSLIGFLRKRRALIILDNCEHVIEAVATLAERIFQETPEACILTTSREPLQVDGEYVYKLPPLESPPAKNDLTAVQALTFPAAHLFVERACAGGYQFELTDADAPVVADICRKLDGIALAIELAAGRVSSYGLHKTAELLDSRLRLLWHGRRTALPRHQTLGAALDWSYSLLTDVQRTVLRQLAIFAGPFTLESAQAVAAGDGLERPQVADAVGLLVAKSLVSISAGETPIRYRLLATTRTYARTKLVESDEMELVSRRHAAHYTELLDRAGADSPETSRNARRRYYAEQLDNVRAALEWCFSERGDIRRGIALSAVSTRLFLEMLLLNECRKWAERALATLDEATRGTRWEMELRTALGVSLMFSKGNSGQAHAALAKAMELAGQLDDRARQFRLIGHLQMFHRRAGNFHREFELAQQGERIAKDLGNPAALVASHSLLGVAHHFIGDQAAARTYLEAALAWPAALKGSEPRQFGFHRDRARIILARTLWVCGCPDQAARLARETVAEAAADEESVTFCIAHIFCASVFHWIGDFASAEGYTERLIAHAEQHSLAPYLAVGFGFKGEGLIKRGAVDTGMALLRSALGTLHADQFELYTTGLNSALAEGLAMSGSLDQALMIVEDTILLVERNGDLLNMPELLRLRGDLLRLAKNEAEAEECFLKSIELAERQSALSWRLRASISLAQLYRQQERHDEAQEALYATYARFSEGFRTADLKTAKSILDEME